MVKILQFIMQIYKQIGMTLLYLSFLVIFQLWICLQKSTFIKVYIFFWWKFSIKLSWLQRIDNKINIIYVYHFFNSNLGLRYPWKRCPMEKGKVEMDNWGSSANLFSGFKKISCRACLLLYYFFREKEKNDF